MTQGIFFPRNPHCPHAADQRATELRPSTNDCTELLYKAPSSLPPKMGSFQGCVCTISQGSQDEVSVVRCGSRQSSTPYVITHFSLYHSLLPYWYPLYFPNTQFTFSPPSPPLGEPSYRQAQPQRAQFPLRLVCVNSAPWNSALCISQQLWAVTNQGRILSADHPILISYPPRGLTDICHVHKISV